MFHATTIMLIVSWARWAAVWEAVLLFNPEFLIGLCPQISNSLPMMDELAKRSVRFIQRCLAIDSSLVKSVANCGIYVGHAFSDIGRNAFCCIFVVFFQVLLLLTRFSAPLRSIFRFRSHALVVSEWCWLTDWLYDFIRTSIQKQN